MYKSKHILPFDMSLNEKRIISLIADSTPMFYSARMSNFLEFFWCSQGPPAVAVTRKDEYMTILLSLNRLQTCLGSPCARSPFSLAHLARDTCMHFCCGANQSLGGSTRSDGHAISCALITTSFHHNVANSPRAMDFFHLHSTNWKCSMILQLCLYSRTA